MENIKESNGNLDKLISVLYLAQSDNRDKMLSELILKVLYNLSKPLKKQDILDYIKSTFHLEPIGFEIDSALETLIENNDVLFNSPYHTLSQDSKNKIFKVLLKTKEDTDKRFFLFDDFVKIVCKDHLTTEMLDLLWTVFNEYLLECFMLFGRQAIEIFLPYEAMEINEDQDIHKQACEKLKDKKLVSVFKKLVIEYPKRLSTLELKYLTSLADKAERFYSLGIEKEEYEKISSLKIKDLVVVCDTNVLYSVLNLRYHSENPAIDEIIKLATTKQVDLRLVYGKSS